MERLAADAAHTQVQSQGLAAVPVDVPIGSTVLVGIDFSEGCERALLRAVALAEEHQAQIALVHVFEWADPESLADDADRPAGERTSGSRWPSVLAQANATRSHVSQLCSALVGDRAAATIHVVIGDPAFGILGAAERAGSSLIVLGNHGRRCTRRGVLGSTAQRICESSAVPVLLVAEQGA